MILQVVGTLTMFIWPAPVLMKQVYMVITGVIMAFLFTGIPEWTTWTLLIAMAVYDVAAVLTPNGPLKVKFLDLSLFWHEFLACFLSSYIQSDCAMGNQ